MARNHRIGCTQNGGPMSNSIIIFSNKIWFVLVNQLPRMMWKSKQLYARFIEWAWLLAPKAFTYGKTGPCYNLIIIVCSWGRVGLQPKKGWNFMQSASRGIDMASRWKHFTHETESPWSLHFKHSHWWKSQSRSMFALNRLCLSNQRNMRMQDGCKVYMDSYVASNGSCFMVTWIIFRNHLLEVGLTHNWETMALRTLTTVDLLYF
jgi:hypothetical protein